MGAQLPRPIESRVYRPMLKIAVQYATALFYIIGGPLIHANLITKAPQIYASIAENAIAPYQWMWNTIVLPNLRPLISLLIFFEMAIGILMVSQKPRNISLGNLAGAFFNLWLIPFNFFYGIPNLLLASLHFWLRYNAQLESADQTRHIDPTRQL